MDPVLNPYTPGAGRLPIALEGRSTDLRMWEAVIARVTHGLPVARSLVLTGLRGVGKTVLLNRMQQMADDAGWLTVKLEASAGHRGETAARQAVGAGLAKGSLRYRTRSKSRGLKAMLAAVTSFNATIGVDGISLGVERDPTVASTGNLELDLQDVVLEAATSLAEDGRGIALFIDEMQDLDDVLTEALISAQHEAGQRNLPFFVVGAGLPSLPARLSDVRSYAERLFDYRAIGKLSVEDAGEALAAPARKGGAEFSDSALAHLVERSGCYPYFIQQYGAAMWEVAAASPFTEHDAAVAGELGTATLDAGFFPSRWERATPAERAYLVAMAEDGEGPSMTGDLADRLAKKVESLGPARARLIAKGLVYSPERGKIAFTVPGFDGFVRRRAGDLEGE